MSGPAAYELRRFDRALRALLRRPAARPRSFKPLRPPTVRFADLAGNVAQLEKTLHREQAVLCVQRLGHLGREEALQVACRAVATELPDLHCGVETLRRWRTRYDTYGLDGLAEQKKGRSGRKSGRGANVSRREAPSLIFPT